jgi:hypothetical protein
MHCTELHWMYYQYKMYNGKRKFKFFLPYSFFPSHTLVKIIDILNQVYEDIWEIFKSKWRNEEEDSYEIFSCAFATGSYSQPISLKNYL